MIWLPATLLAALFQAWRTAVQARVRGQLSVNAAGLARYLFGLPVAFVLLGGWLGTTGQGMPHIDPPFFGWALLAGIAQIIGTNLLLMAFGYRSFVVGTAYAKTEAIQGALLAIFLLGEHLAPLVWAGIALGVIGVMLISARGGALRLADVVQPAALCGLGAGLGFALTAICVRRATLGVAGDDRILVALVALVVVMTGQVLMQGCWLLLRERTMLAQLLGSWRISGQVGLLAALGSACWFTGFATAPVALVRTVGQIEIVATLGFGALYLKQALRRGEVAGLALVVAGVALALAG